MPWELERQNKKKIFLITGFFLRKKKEHQSHQGNFLHILWLSIE